MNINESAQWANTIRMLTRQDRVEGGLGGVANEQATQLAARTQYLKQAIEAFDSLVKSGESPYSSEAEASAAIAAGKIAEGALFAVRSASSFLWVDEYKNVGGIATPTGKHLPSSLLTTPTFSPDDTDPDGTVTGVSVTAPGQYFCVRTGNPDLPLALWRNNNGTAERVFDIPDGRIMPEFSALSAGTLYRRVDPESPLLKGVYYEGGVKKTDGDTTWDTSLISVAAGDLIKLTGVVGSYTRQESRAVMTQLDATGAWVSTLAAVRSQAAPFHTTVYAVAQVSGYVAVTYRADSPNLGANVVYRNTRKIITDATLGAELQSRLTDARRYGAGIDYTSTVRTFSGARYLSDGTLETGKGNAYAVMYVPASAGDVVRLSGAAGVASRAEVIPVLVQTDPSRRFVSVLQSVTSDGNYSKGDFYAVAAQTGYIAVCWRVIAGITTAVTRFPRLLDYRSGIADTVLRPVTHEATITRGQRMTMAGVAEAASGWFIATLPVRRGDDVAIDALHDSFSSADVTPVICQLDSKKAFVSVLCQFTNTGAGPNRDTFIATASQDGYVAVTARLTGNAPFALFASRQAFCDPLDIWLEQQTDASGEADYTLVNKYEVNNTVIDSEFALLTDASWRTVWVPVRRGESVSAYTATGAAATGETPADDGSVPVMIQYDTRRANPVIRATASGTGSLTGYQTVSAKATADGFMAVRLYAADRGWPTVKRLAAKNGSDSGVASLPVVPGQFERLPVNADTNWDYNNSPYSQDNVVIAGDYQYAVVIGAGRVPYIAQRSKWGGAWLAVFDLGTIAGNPLASPTTADGHNVYNIGVSKNGHIIVAGNMHGDGPRAVVSDNPHNITAWTAVDFSAGMFTKDVTYPHFISYPDGTLQCYYRWGVRHYLTTYDESTKTFITPRHIVGAKADGRGGPYEQKYVVDNDGILHACWGYRMDATSALANEGLYYSQSADKGATWRAADGSVISAAGTRNDANSTRIFSAETGSGYVNQNGGCVDIHGHYHTCLTQYDDNGNTQIVHVWWDGSAWKSEVVTDFDFRMNLSSNLVMNDITRPVIGATPSGRVYIIYHTTYNGLSGAVMAVDVTDEGNPQSMVIAAFDIGTQSMGFNVAHMLKTGDFMALMAKGVANSSSPGYGTFSAQPVMLATVPMP